MGRARGKDLVLAGALAATLLDGGFLVLRARGLVGAHWSDGRARLAGDAGELRYAVWDEPEVLGALGCAAHDPALSPDGRLLVVAVGERGHDADLWVSELDGDIAGDVPGAARPLSELNTSGDELAPAFAPAAAGGALYFASDRPGGEGGLDLWRASFSDGALGAVEHVGGGLNSSADDTDPAPLASGALVFASDRAATGDHDLYQAEPAGDGYALTALDALATPFEEREPVAAPDDLALYFASDRPGAGGFDLLRSLRAGGRWLAPAPLRSLNGPLDERGPWASADGARLLFERRDAEGEPTLVAARSRELYLVPPGAPSVRERWALAGLAGLAAAALVARVWHLLNLHHRALLASLGLHAGLLVYMSVHVASGGASAPPSGDETYPIQLVPRPQLDIPPERMARLEEAAKRAREEEHVVPAPTDAKVPASAQAAPRAAQASPPVQPPVGKPLPVKPEVAQAEAPPVPVPVPVAKSEVSRGEVVPGVVAPSDTDGASLASSPPPRSAEPAADEEPAAGGAPAPPPPELGTPEGKPLPAPTPLATKLAESAPPAREVPTAASEPAVAERKPTRPSETAAIPAPRGKVEVAPGPESSTPPAGASSKGAPDPAPPAQGSAPRADASRASSAAADAAREVAGLMRDPALLAAASAELSGEERRGFSTVLLSTPEDQEAIARFFGEELVLVPRQTLDPAAKDARWFRIAPGSGRVEEQRGRPALEQYRQYRDLFDYEYARLPETLRELRRTLPARGEVYLFAALVPAREWAVVLARRADALARSGRALSDVRTFVLRYLALGGGAFDLAVDHVVFADGSRFRPDPAPEKGLRTQ